MTTHDAASAAAGPPTHRGSCASHPHTAVRPRSRAVAGRAPDRGVGRSVVAALAVLLVASVAACGSPDGEDGGAAGTTGNHPTIVVTTTILADITRNVVGDTATVESILPAGTDPHGFEPSAAQVARVHDADLVVAVGLGLEAGLAGPLDSAADAGVPLLELAPELSPVPFGRGTADDDHAPDQGEDDGHAHEAGDLDPHVWTDPDRMTTAATRIAAAVAEHTDVDPATLDRNAAAYDAELRLLDEDIQAILAGIPAERRTLVTNHGSLGYFADRYGFEVVGTVIPGGSTLAEPSAAGIAELSATIRDTGVPAVFTEEGVDDSVATSLADEVGRRVAVVPLFTDALGPPGSGADTYIGLMTTNAESIAEALVP